MRRHAFRQLLLCQSVSVRRIWKILRFRCTTTLGYRGRGAGVAVCQSNNGSCLPESLRRLVHFSRLRESRRHPRIAARPPATAEGGTACREHRPSCDAQDARVQGSRGDRSYPSDAVCPASIRGQRAAGVHIGLTKKTHHRHCVASRRSPPLVTVLGVGRFSIVANRVDASHRDAQTSRLGETRLRGPTP